MHMQSWTHGTTEWSGLGRALKTTSLQTPCHGGTLCNRPGCSEPHPDRLRILPMNVKQFADLFWHSITSGVCKWQFSGFHESSKGLDGFWKCWSCLCTSLWNSGAGVVVCVCQTPFAPHHRLGSFPLALDTPYLSSSSSRSTLKPPGAWQWFLSFIRPFLTTGVQCIVYVTQ